MKNKSNKPKRHKDWIYFDMKTGAKMLLLSQRLKLPLSDVFSKAIHVADKVLKGELEINGKTGKRAFLE
jgi:hypothetical protein